MLPSLLVLAHAAGIVWADRGHSLPALAGVLWLIAGLALCCGLAAEIRRQCKPDRRGSAGRRRRLRATALLWLIGLFFLLGLDRLDSVLEAARSDRVLAEAGRTEGVRLAEAHVRARRRGRWGDEVSLEQVRGIDGGPRLPERLLLRLDENVDSPDGAVASRAERLLWPGAWVRVGIRVRPLRAARNPGTRDRTHFEARRAFAARARLVKPDWVMALSGGGLSGLRSTESIGARREAWRQRVASRFDDERLSAGLVRALALGDRTGISDQTRQSFRRLGLSHLIAISGLHIAFVAGWTAWLALRTIVWLCPRMRSIEVFDWTLVIACLAAGFYAWLTDAGISVERASLLFGLFAVFRLALRTVAPSTALAFVALVMLIGDPAALFDLGAQLSFGACSALIAAGSWRTAEDPPVETEQAFFLRAFRGLGATFRTSLVVSLGTAPLLAQHGFPMSVLSPLFNVVAIPWTGFVVLPSSFVAVSLIDVLPVWLLRALTLPALGLEVAASEVAARLPGGHEELFFSMSIFLILIAVGFFAIRRARWRVATLLWVVVSFGGASAIDFASAALLESPRVIFFDVGQGDAALIQGREAVILVDTGPGPSDDTGGATLVRALRAAEVTRIDVLVITHGDLDHRAGLMRVLETFEVEQLWLPSAGASDAALSDVAAKARRNGTRVVWQEAERSGIAPDEIVGDLEVSVLWPVVAVSGIASSRNDHSVVLRVVVEKKVFLFTADIGTRVENELMKRRRRLDADVLKIGHHGSRGSSSAAFLNRVSPEIAVLSAPCDAARGLPNRQAIARIRQSGAALWWTGRDGAVIVQPESGGTLTVESWGEPRECSPR